MTGDGNDSQCESELPDGKQANQQRYSFQSLYRFHGLSRSEDLSSVSDRTGYCECTTPPVTVLSARLVIAPGDLKLDFFSLVAALMFDVDRGGRGYRDALTGDLYPEALALFDAVGKPT